MLCPLPHFVCTSCRIWVLPPHSKLPLKILLFFSKKMNSLLLHATSVERNKLKLQKCNLLRRTEMGHEWTSSLHSTNRLCSSHILGMSGGAFLRRASAYSPKPRTNTTFIFRHNGALPARHEIAFHYKTSSDMKENTQLELIWMWSKIDLKYTLMARDTYRRHCYYNMMQHLPPLDFMAYSKHMKNTFFFCLSCINKKFRWPLKQAVCLLSFHHWPQC